VPNKNVAGPPYYQGTQATNKITACFPIFGRVVAALQPPHAPLPSLGLSDVPCTRDLQKYNRLKTQFIHKLLFIDLYH